MGNPQIDGDNIAYPAHMAVVIHRCTANPRPVPARQGEKSVFDLLFMSVYRVKTQRAENALHIPVIRVPGAIVRSGYAAPVLLKENRLPPAAQCHGFPGSQPYFLGFFLPFRRQKPKPGPCVSQKGNGLVKKQLVFHSKPPLLLYLYGQE